jgi:aminoglycoside phosphotransferase (APT) family kinase protein
MNAAAAPRPGQPGASPAQEAFEDLRRAVRRRFGAAADIENISVPTLGGSNRTVIFDLIDGSSRRRLASRQETYTAEDTPFRSTSEQFRVMKIVRAHGFPAPEPIFEYDEEDAMGRGFVTAFVAGETMPKRIIGDPALVGIRTRLAARLGQLLALLHAIDPAEAGFLETCADSLDPVAAQRDRLDVYGEAHPAIELGLRWLERNRPPPTKRVLVHGDFRNGNFLVGPDGVNALLDWECCHISSGMEDLGWLCTRSWRFGSVDLPVGGFSARAPLYEAYEAAGGGRVDPDIVRYWEVFGLVRWSVLNVMQAYGHVRGGRRSVAFAACGRNTSLIEYDLLMTLAGRYV